MESINKIIEWGGTKKKIALLMNSALALLSSILGLASLPFDAAWVAILLCGIPIILEAAVGLVTAFDIKADVLVSLALIASVCIGENFAAGEIAFIMQLGGLLEELTVAKARAGIEKLVDLTPQTARVICGNFEKIIPAEQVRVGDRLRVQPGETVPVDGIIICGQTSINQAVMTGESFPVDKTVGDEVSSETVNQYGAFEMEAVKVGENSSVQRMIRLVQSADAGKAKIVGLADRWATWIVVIALTAAALTWVFSGQIIRAVTILVVFCPCALVLATPTAVMAAIGNATKHGFLVKEGDALERLAQVRRIAFDKTGTLTCGTPAVTAGKGMIPGMTGEKLLEIAASAELPSEHPLGKAIVGSYQKKTGKNAVPPETFSMLPGLGVSAEWNGKTVLVGNEKFLVQSNVALPSEVHKNVEEFVSQGCTIVYVGVEQALAGFLVLSDAPRPGTGEVLQEIKNIGVAPLLLTGDNENAARAIAGKLGIGDFRAGCLPEDKLNWIGEYQNRGEPVCMIGGWGKRRTSSQKSSGGDRNGRDRQRHCCGCSRYCVGE